MKFTKSQIEVLGEIRGVNSMPRKRKSSGRGKWKIEYSERYARHDKAIGQLIASEIIYKGDGDILQVVTNAINI